MEVLTLILAVAGLVVAIGALVVALKIRRDGR
jgi:hypothetical protein